MKKILIFLLTLIMAFGGVTTAIAAEITNPGGGGQSEVILDHAATSFDVMLPTSLPVTVDADGNVFTSGTCWISNYSYGPIAVKDVLVNRTNGWAIVPYNTDFHAQKVGLKQFGMRINGSEVYADGAVSLTEGSWPSIDGFASLQLNYSAVIAAQDAALNNTTIADVVITVGWDEYDPGWVLATDSDFVGDQDGDFYYIGDAEYVEIPSDIKGVTLTTLENMFYGNSTIKGVKLPYSANIMYMAYADRRELEQEIIRRHVACVAIDEKTDPKTPVSQGGMAQTPVQEEITAVPKAKPLLKVRPPVRVE